MKSHGIGVGYRYPHDYEGADAESPMPSSSTKLRPEARSTGPGRSPGGEEQHDPPGSGSRRTLYARRATLRSCVPTPASGPTFTLATNSAHEQRARELITAAVATATSSPAVPRARLRSRARRTCPEPSSVLEDAFVATSSCGVRASKGTSDMVAGRTGAPNTAAIPARPNTTARAVHGARATPPRPA